MFKPCFYSCFKVKFVLTKQILLKKGKNKMITFKISEFKKDIFEAKMSRYARKAQKLGIEFGYTLESESTESIRDRFGNEFRYSVYNYSVIGESPTIKGYTFLAKIESFEGSNLIHSHNVNFDFSEYRTADLVCQHCNVTRERNFYYLIQRDNDKSIIMLGRNCLSNYIGLDNAEDIAEFYSSFIVGLELYNDNADDMSEKIKTGAYKMSINMFLSYCILAVNESGFISTKDQSENKISTKNQALNLLFWGSTADKIIPTDNDKALAEKIAEHVKNELNKKDNLNEYEHTILTLLMAGYIKVSHAGYIASIIPLYNRMMESSVSSKSDNNSMWIGIEGEKLNNISCKVVYQSRIESQFVTYLYKFITAQGNHITYFSSKNLNLVVGQNVIIEKCTVKKHDVYNSIKQTIITRGKIQ
jgi:hypothetical protein